MASAINCTEQDLTKCESICEPSVRFSGALVFVSGLLVKLGLSLCFPALYGGDTVLHLRNHEQLFLGHQPPALQALLFVTHRVSPSPLAWRFLMLALGALAGLGFYLLSTQALPRASALWAGLFFVASPFLNEVSLVPFQEMLMIALLCFALYTYSKRQFMICALFLLSACWTRYEAWLLCPVLIVDYRFQHWSTRRSLFLVPLLFSLGPLAWIAVHHGLTSPGAYTIEFPRSPARLVRIVYLLWVCLKQSPWPLLAFIPAAIVGAWRSRRCLALPWRDCLLFFSLYFVAILCSAHGLSHSGMPNPELFVDAREAALLVCFTLLLGALGFSQYCGPYRSLLGVLIILCGLAQSWFLVRSQVIQPNVAVSYQVAHYLNCHVTPTQRILFVAKPFTPDDWSYYVQQAERSGGSAGLAAAHRALQQLDLSPMDYQRTAVQTNLPNANLLSSADPLTVQWIVTWNNASIPPSISNALVRFTPAAVMRQGKLAATVWQRSL